MSLRTHPLAPVSGRPVLGGIALALCLIAGPAAGQTLKTAGGDLLLSSVDGRSFVAPGGRGRVELPLSKAARVSDLRSTGGRWFVAAVGRAAGKPTLEVLAGSGGAVEAVGPPAVEPVAELHEPVFFADGEGIHGLAWLAGGSHRQLAVQVARWLDGGWGPPVTVSPPGEGTQIALATAVLGDGSWLLAWAAFDGRDDEILWSRLAGGAWSPPRPVAEDNAVPDITPHLFATAEGALLAWSRYDGNDYRIQVARFDGEGWSLPASIGPRGSTAPSFGDAEAPYLIYHVADPRAWAVMELDATGRVRREAAIELAEPQRPVLASVTEEAVTLEWVSLERQMVSSQLPWVER